LDPAPLHIGFLLDRDHLPFHLGELGRCLLIPADEERGRPKDDDRRGSRQSVIGALTVLDAREGGGSRRDRLGFLGELLAGVFTRPAIEPFCIVAFQPSLSSVRTTLYQNINAILQIIKLFNWIAIADFCLFDGFGRRNVIDWIAIEAH
jgi:hypothetical protein